MSDQLRAPSTPPPPGNITHLYPQGGGWVNPRMYLDMVATTGISAPAGRLTPVVQPAAWSLCCLVRRLYTRSSLTSRSIILALCQRYAYFSCQNHSIKQQIQEHKFAHVVRRMGLEDSNRIRRLYCNSYISLTRINSVRAFTITYVCYLYICCVMCPCTHTRGKSLVTF